jgi:voltage-gated potassium channel
MLRYTLFYLRTLFGSLGDPQVRPYLVAATSLIAVGTVFYSLVEGWDPFDAAYFCVTSLATVCYGDLSPVTRLGRLFTMIYIIAGLGVLSAFIAAITRVSVEQMELRRQNHVPLRPLRNRLSKSAGSGEPDPVTTNNPGDSDEGEQ